MLRTTHFCVGILLVLGACNAESGTTQQTQPTPRSSTASQTVRKARILAPSRDTLLVLGQTLPIYMAFDSGVESLSYQLNGGESIVVGHDEMPIPFSTSEGIMGDNSLNFQIQFTDQSQERLSLSFQLLSDLKPQLQTYEVVDVYPHNEGSFTQGLFYLDGIMYEGSGQAGKSAIRSYEPRSGKVQKEVYIPPEYFGEGIALLGDVIYQLTYQAKKILLYNFDTFNQVGERPWSSEGWGLTTDGNSLILSDGSAYLYFLDPVSMVEQKRVKVSDGNRFVTDINELEYIEGLVYANVWETDSIIGIDPANGKVMTYLNLTGILPGYSADQQRSKVLNGIAYIPERRSLVVTGKEWPQMFEIRVRPFEPH